MWSTLIALFVALILGGLSGYKGDHTDKISILQAVWLIIGLVCTQFYAKEWSFYLDAEGLFSFHLSSYLIVVGLGIIFLGVGVKILSRIKSKTFYIKWDTIIVKLMEVFKSIPGLFILLAIFAIITKPSLTAVILIIGFIRWPGMTRLIRAEILKTKQEGYIKNAQLLGLPTYRIIMRHIFPNIYKSVLILVALNMGTAILIESSLSFLEIGLPIDEVSWGRMLGASRGYIPAWWMAIGPGLLIFVMILSFNVLGARLSHHFEVDNEI